MSFRGSTAVTPVRTGPSPIFSAPLPCTIVACPTRTPATSVMAFSGPGGNVPRTMPRSRARTRCVCADDTETKTARKRMSSRFIEATAHIMRLSVYLRESLRQEFAHDVHGHLRENAGRGMRKPAADAMRRRVPRRRGYDVLGGQTHDCRGREHPSAVGRSSLERSRERVSKPGLDALARAPDERGVLMHHPRDAVLGGAADRRRSVFRGPARRV